MVRHHRKCRSNGGKSNKRNISFLEYHLHVAWHILFKNWKPEQIAKEINEKYLDPDFELVVQKRRQP